MRFGLFDRLMSKLAGMASQVVVAVFTTVLASGLVASLRSAPEQNPLPHAGKFTDRVAGGTDSNVIQTRLSPLPVLAMDGYPPLAFAPAAPAAAPTAVPASGARMTTSVLPPHRPKELDSVAQAPSPIEQAPAEKPHGFVLAALRSPMAALDFGRLAPGREALSGVIDSARSAVDWVAHVAIR